MMQEILCAVFVILGALFIAMAGIGILRMPDLFIRMSCTTKATTLGTGFVMLAVAVRFPQLEIITRTVVITLFTFLTAPVAAHMIARAAYVSGVQLWDKTKADQLCNRYDRCTCTLASCPVEDPPGKTGGAGTEIHQEGNEDLSAGST